MEFEINARGDVTLTFGKDEPIEFGTFGCGGTGKAEQTEVGNAIADNPIIRFLLILGDMFYARVKGYATDGLESRDDDKLITQFEKPYSNISTDVHAMALAGNHEYRYYRMGQGINKGLKATGDMVTQNTLGFLHAGLAQWVSGVTNAAVDSLSTRPEELASNFFNMQYEEKRSTPHKGPSLHTSSRGYNKVTIYRDGEETPLICFFMMDSNTFPRDKKQQAWFAKELRASEAKRNIIAQHHPWVTHNKLVFDNHDTKWYGYAERDLLEHELASVRNHFKSRDSRNYNDLYALVLKHVIDSNNLWEKIHMSISAHAHLQAVSVINEHPLFANSKEKIPHDIVQIVAGTGGGELQRAYWRGHEPLYIAEKLGFVHLELDKKNVLSFTFKSKKNEPLAAFKYSAHNCIGETLNADQGHTFYAKVIKAIHGYMHILYRTPHAKKNLKLTRAIASGLEKIEHHASMATDLTLLERKHKIELDYLRMKEASSNSDEISQFSKLIRPCLERQKEDYRQHIEDLIEACSGDNPDNFQHPTLSDLKEAIINFLFKKEKTQAKEYKDPSFSRVLLSKTLKRSLLKIFTTIKGAHIEEGEDGLDALIRKMGTVLNEYRDLLDTELRKIITEKLGIKDEGLKAREIDHLSAVAIDCIEVDVDVDDFYNPFGIAP